MPRQSLLWTALPNGLTPDGRGLRLSVLVSPRLDPEDATPALSSFPAFERWPDTLRGAAFTVRADTTTVRLTFADLDDTLGTPDPATWLALLPGTTPVRAFEFHDRTEDRVLSYDTLAIHDLAQKIYARLATGADDLPTIADLLTDDALGPLVSTVQEIDREFWDRGEGRRDVNAQRERWRKTGFRGMKELTASLARFQLFHTPASKATTQTVEPRHDPRTAVTFRTYEKVKIDAEQWVRELDFHQIVSAMNQYPTLLRRLGLVLDFVLPRAALPTGASVPLSVSVALRGADDVPTASPITRTRIARTAFVPVPRPASPATPELRVANGLLRMDGGRFALIQADVDGAGLKLMNFARSLAAHDGDHSWRQLDPVSKLPRRAGAPALRTAGLMLVHHERGAALERTFENNGTLATAVQAQIDQADAPAPALHAEDLVRGWRVDVWERASGRWRSLCERVAAYEVGGGAVALRDLREEGTVRLAATSAADGTDPDVVRLHEALTVWGGWSLVAPPPGRTIDRDDELRDPAATVPDGIPLRTSFTAAPGTLPRLRYGRTYAVRLRAVDLAGNSLPPSTESYPGDDASIANAAPYLRYEPVEPPALALVAATEEEAKAELHEGESMARVAVRTMNDVFDDPTPTAAEARRWAVAPRTSVTVAEVHGMLDGPAWGSAQQYALLAERDRELAQATIELEGPLTDPERPLPEPEPDEVVAMPHYAILPPDASLLPYLPDPLCRSVSARLLNHPLIGAGELIPIPLYPGTRDWPDAAPFRVLVYEHDTDRPRFDEGTRTLRVPTPKAVRATLRLASMLEPDALDLLGVWQWIPEAERTAALSRQARMGRLWALTPWREIEIVHAVQRPLLAPTITDLVLRRERGMTHVHPGVDARVHRASTDRVDLHAAWHEPRDAAGADAPENLSRADVAFTVNVTDPNGYGATPDHLLPDDADPDHIAFGPARSLTQEKQRHVRGKPHDFGDTRYRRVEYHLVGTSRFREYMPPELLVETGADGTRRTLDEHITVTGPVVRSWVPSSAPPPAPEVLYLVPTFGWTRGADAEGKRTSWRRGGGLRVWLDRPWNASGYGEMLAVVLPPRGSTVDPNEPPYEHTVTQWGNDPVWKSPFVSGTAPAAKSFPLSRSAPDPAGAWLPPGAPATEADQPPEPFRLTALTHPGLLTGAEGTVDIAPHDVFWDEERQLWYCDIEIDFGGAYYPFVRLALARYQSSSVEGAHLSSIVIADFMSLTPDRWLTVTRTNARTRHVRVVGPTHTRSAGYDEAFAQRVGIINPAGQQQIVIPTGISPTNVVEVWLEELAEGASEDFGWRRIADGDPTPTLAPTRPGGTTAKRPTGKQAPGRVATKSTQRRTAADTARAAEGREYVRQRDYEAVVASSLLDVTFEWPTLWSGSLTLPQPRTAGSRYRAVVAEYEEYLVDDTDPYESPLERKERRLVFVEHVELT